MDVKHFLATQIAERDAVITPPKFLIDGRNSTSILLMILGCVLGSGMIVLAWSHTMRDKPCGHGQGAWTCDLFQSIPYPISEMALSALGCLIIMGVGVLVAKKFTGGLRIAVFEEHVEFIRPNAITAIRNDNMVPTFSVRTVKSTTVEQIEFSDDVSGSVVTVVQPELGKTDWVKLREFAQGMPKFRRFPVFSTRIQMRIKALFKKK